MGMGMVGILLGMDVCGTVILSVIKAVLGECKLVEDYDLRIANKRRRMEYIESILFFKNS